MERDTGSSLYQVLVQGLGFSVWRLGFRVLRLGFRVFGLGFKVYGLEFWVSDSVVRVSGFN